MLGCATSPRVVEVTGRTRLLDVDLVDQKTFLREQVGRLHYRPHYLTVEDQREEFYVHWNPGEASKVGSTSTVNLVKFEYQQLDKPNIIKEQTFTPTSTPHPRDVDQELLGQPRSVPCTAHVFEIRGEEFRAGGSVSAWRVTLWNDDRLLAERKSALW